MIEFMHWSKFREKISPPPTARVGKRWIRDRIIPGKFIDGEPYVDMRKWNGEQVDEMVEEMCQ